MTKQYETLYVFGDSYTTPGYCVDPKDSFWGLTASYANINTIINYSMPGHPWDGVKHVLASESKKIEWNSSLLLICIPPLERFLVFDDFKNSTWHYHKYENWVSSEHVVECERGLIPYRHFDQAHEVAMFAERSLVETFALRDLFFIDQWLQRVNANYLFINLVGRDLDSKTHWSPSEFVLPYFLEHKNSILFENGYHSLNRQDNIKPADYNDYKWGGHHGPEGNANFFQKSLLSKLKDVKLI